MFTVCCLALHILSHCFAINIIIIFWFTLCFFAWSETTDSRPLYCLSTVGHRDAGANPSELWVQGGVHHEQDANPSQA